jgi:hypothetical protein
MFDLAVERDGGGLLFGLLFRHGSDYTWAVRIVLRY